MDFIEGLPKSFVKDVIWRWWFDLANMHTLRPYLTHL